MALLSLSHSRLAAHPRFAKGAANGKLPQPLSHLSLEFVGIRSQSSRLFFSRVSFPQARTDPKSILILHPHSASLLLSEGVRPGCHAHVMASPAHAPPARLKPAPGFGKQNFQEFYLHWPVGSPPAACPSNSWVWKYPFSGSDRQRQLLQFCIFLLHGDSLGIPSDQSLFPLFTWANKVNLHQRAWCNFSSKG